MVPKSEIRNPKSEILLLRSLGLTAYLLLNLPMREKILVTAPGTFPGSLDWVSALQMEHFHNQVTVQTHGRMTKDLVSLGGFGHNCHRNLLLVGPRTLKPRRSRGRKLITYNGLAKSADNSRL
jgi:hypothetical protein